MKDECIDGHKVTIKSRAHSSCVASYDSSRHDLLNITGSQSHGAYGWLDTPAWLSSARSSQKTFSCDLLAFNMTWLVPDILNTIPSCFDMARTPAWPTDLGRLSRSSWHRESGKKRHTLLTAASHNNQQLLGLSNTHQTYTEGAWYLQVVWSPFSAHTCAVVTQEDQLLLGELGKDLQALVGAKDAVCVAWSPDGCHLVYGRGKQVHVYDTAQSRKSWDVQFASKEQVWHAISTIPWNLAAAGAAAQTKTRSCKLPNLYLMQLHMLSKKCRLRASLH